MVKKILGALRFAWYWDKALNATTQKQYTLALDHVGKMEALSPYVPNPQILKIYLLYVLRQDEYCILAAKRAVNIVRRSSIYSGEEERYLLCYILTWARSAADSANCTSEFDFEINVEELDLSRVRPHVQRNFPLRHHPQWVEK